MENPQADVTHLKWLRGEHKKVTEELNIKILELGQAKARVQIINAETDKLKNMQNLVLQDIMIEKKLFDANMKG